MTLTELAEACIEAQRRRGPEATVTLTLPGPVRGARARLWPGGPLAEILCENVTADGRVFRVVSVRSAVVLGALARIASRLPAAAPPSRGARVHGPDHGPRRGGNRGRG
jgi:hypothetical protein